MSGDMEKLNLEGMAPEMRVSLDELRKNMTFMMEYEQLQAHVTRAKFEALKLVGFTEVQAIELCKKHA